MISISTHVLDTSSGTPGRGISAVLRFQTAPGAWKDIASGITNDDGRIPGLIPEGSVLTPGIYRMVFESGPYFQKQGKNSFYPYVMVHFEIKEESHYHVPLLLSPFGYSTYRGS